MRWFEEYGCGCVSPYVKAKKDLAFALAEGDALDFFRRYRFSGRDLIYCDPPYVPSSRKSQAPIYRYEMTHQQHEELLAQLRKIPALIMVSGYASPLYECELSHWNHTRFQAMTRRGMATEYLWFNFEPPKELHDTQYLGENFRDRERLKRKKARWVTRLEKMPQLERQALLEAIQAAGLAESGESGDAGLQRRK